MAAPSAAIAPRPAPKVGAVASTPNCFRGVQYFFTGSYLQTTEGIENPLPTLNAIHDFSQQEKGFAYMSTFVDPYTRLSLIAGTATNTFPDSQCARRAYRVPAILRSPASLGTSFNSAQLNENQYEDTQFGVLALQRSVNGFDGQLSYFTRYNNLHFTPDPIGDLLLNGIASDISRQSLYQRHPGRRLLSDQCRRTRCAWASQSAANRPSVDNTSLVEPARRRCAIDAPESITDDVVEARLARRRLCAGRVEDHQQVDDECRAALRPDVAICRCQSVKPARQLHL